MSEGPTTPTAKRPAQKNGRHEGGQVQGGNAQEGRAAASQSGGIAIPRCSNMVESLFPRKRKNTLCETFPYGNCLKSASSGI
jgi:hypothetical protein